MIKPEIRIIGWDDCAFTYAQRRVMLVGPVFRGGRFMDGLISTYVEKDGMDATEKITTAIVESRNYGQLSVIMLDGVSFAGFNLVDIRRLSKRTRLPVIVAQRKLPDIKKFTAAMKNLPGLAARKRCVAAAGKFYKYGDKLYYQRYGLGTAECSELLTQTCIRSNIPEPLRIAHIIASGLSGESRGRA